MAAPLKVRVTVMDAEDVMCLVAYRMVLQEIAKGEVFDPAAQLAREVLSHFDDSGDAD